MLLRISAHHDLISMLYYAICAGWLVGRWDNPLENKYWLNEITCRVASFLTQEPSLSATDPANLDSAGFLAQYPEDEHAYPSRAGWPRCYAVCERTTCVYNWTNSSLTYIDDDVLAASATFTCPYTWPEGYSPSTGDDDGSSSSSLSHCEVSFIVTSAVLAACVVVAASFAWYYYSSHSRALEESLLVASDSINSRATSRVHGVGDSDGGKQL